ncbi:MAG: universal stress protein [Sphingobacteriales bacterium]|nr:universal stress protein [Sphingobacteriales bacterium]
MQKMFTKILLPVSFDRNIRWSVDKTIQLANKFGCDILLLHVQVPSSIPFLSNTFFSDPLAGYYKEDWEKKVKELELHYRSKLNEGLLLSSISLIGYWPVVLKDIIITKHIDLVVIPGNNRRFSSAEMQRININKLSQQTNCPIMTITRNFNANQLQKIVVPVHDLLPVKKLTIATYVSLETNGCIYLMGGDHHTTAGDKGYLIKAYQLLNDLGKLNIQCALRENDDTANSTLAYAKDVKANLIIVNPGQESRLRGWWNKLRGKYLNQESDIPILTVAF